MHGVSLAMVDDFKSKMKEFEMTDLGLLGLEMKQDNHGIFVTQRKYAEDPLGKFNMHNCKVAPTPMNVCDKFQAENGS